MRIITDYTGGEFYSEKYFIKNQKMNDTYKITLLNFEMNNLDQKKIDIIFTQPYMHFDLVNVEYKVQFGCNLKCPLFFRIFVDKLQISRNEKWTMKLKIEKNNEFFKNVKLSYFRNGN